MDNAVASADSTSGSGPSPAEAPEKALKAEFSYPVEVSIKSLLAAGAHFGHQTDKWNPKMLPYIYCAKNGIHIINLDITLEQWKKARQALVDTAARGGSVLLVGTKQQARETVQQEAERCGSFYVTTRWLGGTLSNFQTIKNSIERMQRLEELLEKANQEGTNIKLNKKEKLEISRELRKLEMSLSGIRSMKKLPDLIFVVDLIKEAIAVAEARRLRIPVIALVDTNTDPELVNYPLVANDDASRTIRLFAAAVADAVLEGKAQYAARAPKEAAGGGDGGGIEVIVQGKFAEQGAEEKAEAVRGGAGV